MGLPDYAHTMVVVTLIILISLFNAASINKVKKPKQKMIKKIVALKNKLLYTKSRSCAMECLRDSTLLLLLCMHFIVHMARPVASA